MKKKIILCFIIVVFTVFTTGITYSVFTSNSLLTSNQKIAKFIFNTEQLDSLSLPLSGLTPGDEKEYSFQVSNNSKGVKSNITLNYSMIIKTYHFMPTTIKLYRVIDDVEELFMTCDETFTRNDQNELVCNTTTMEMKYSSNEIHEYKLIVSFDDEYSGLEYTDLIDYIDIQINSWQKIGSV